MFTPGAVLARKVAMDQARSLWGSGGRTAFGPFEVALASDERPILWTSDERSPVLLTSRGSRAVVYRILIDQAGARAEVVIPDLVFRSLRKLIATPSGVFAVDGDGLTAARQGADGAWSLTRSILPAGAEVVGMGRDEAGRLQVLTRVGEQLRLFTGRGMAPLRLTASGPQTDYGGWWDLAVDDDGTCVIWGGGHIGRADPKTGRLVLEADPRAPRLPLALHERGQAAGMSGAAEGSLQGALPTSAETPSGWGVLFASSRRFNEAPADLPRPLAVTGLGDDAAILYGPAGPTLVRTDGGVGPLTSIPIGGWGRDAPSGGALGVLDGDVLAIATAGASTDAFLLRTDESRRSIGLGGTAHFDIGRRAMTAPTPVGSMPPLALVGGVVVGMMMEQLTLWLAPWQEAG